MDDRDSGREGELGKSVRAARDYDDDDGEFPVVLFILKF